MSLPPITGERSGAPPPPQRQQQRQAKRQQLQNDAKTLRGSPTTHEAFDDSFSGAGVSTASTAATNVTTTTNTNTQAAAAAAADFRIVVAARIRPFTAREVQQWRRERRSTGTLEETEEARRARAGLRQPFGPGHKSLNAAQGAGLDGTWASRRREGGGDDDRNRGSLDTSEVPNPVVEVESDGTTIALLDAQSMGAGGDALANPVVRNTFTYDYVYSSFAPNVVLDAPSTNTGRGGAESPYVIFDGDDEENVSDRQARAAPTPAQELRAEAEQVAIYEQLAIPLVDAALQGYNTCMFAYGQTGSGKTYTMMGTPRYLGLIPRLCRLLFSKIAARNDGGGDGGADASKHGRTPAPVTLQLSYMEIYNEQVRDLLKQRPKNAILHYKSRFDKKDVDSDEYRTLKVRHHPSKGIYVDGLTSVPVRTWDECEAYLQAGNALRTQCSTAMNAKSSRSHAIFQLQMTQRESTGGRVRGREVALETFSKINLVDLAGSERNTQSKTTGKHLAEANSINASLSTLRRVLGGLIANRAAALGGAGNAVAGVGGGGGGRGKKGAVVIPYRESLLTYVLSDNLGGNSFTVMCANVSPCASSAGETESTLRYATLAKSVVNHARLNEAPAARVIREMREQLHTMQEALRTAPDPSQVAALEEGMQISEQLLREMRSREKDYVAVLHTQAAEVEKLQQAVEAHQRQEAYWRSEAQRQQRDVEQLREALFEATQSSAHATVSSGGTAHAKTNGGGVGGGSGAVKKKKSSSNNSTKPQNQKCQSTSLANMEEALLSLAANPQPPRGRATPLSLLGGNRAASKERCPVLPPVLRAPISAPEKGLRRSSVGNGHTLATAPNSREARAVAKRARVGGDGASRPPLPVAGSRGVTYGADSDGGDTQHEGGAASAGDDGNGCPASTSSLPYYHTEEYLADADVERDDDAEDADDHGHISPPPQHPRNARGSYGMVDLMQLQEEATCGGNNDNGFEGGLGIEGVAAAPSRRQWPTVSPRVAATRKLQAANDRRRSSISAAAKSAKQYQQQQQNKKNPKKAGKSGESAGKASPGVSKVRDEEWPAGEASTSAKLAAFVFAAGVAPGGEGSGGGGGGGSAHSTHELHRRGGDDERNTLQLSASQDSDDAAVQGVRTASTHTPTSDAGLTEMHAADPEERGDEDEADSGDQDEREMFDEEPCSDDVDSAAASLTRSTMTASAVQPLHKTVRRKVRTDNPLSRSASWKDERHYSTVDMLH